MTVGPHSTKLPQSWDTESDQLGVPAILRIRAGPPVAAKDHTIRMNICNLANGIPWDDRSASVCVRVRVCACVWISVLRVNPQNPQTKQPEFWIRFFGARG